MKRLIVSLLIIALISSATLYASTLFGFQTKYPFGFYNLTAGALCFPLLLPVTSLSTWVSCIFLLGIGAFMLFGIREAIAEKKFWSIFVISMRLILFLWCITLCDYSYWDIANSSLSSNMNYSFIYQEYQHVDMSYGNFALLGYILCMLNLGAFLFFLYLVPSGIIEKVTRNVLIPAT